MASEVDIVNLALAHIGASATVSSLSPPEGSAYAERCAQFYPIARNSLLEMHAWNFATRRAALAEVTNTVSSWLYAYAMPAGAKKCLGLYDPDATDDDDVQPHIVEDDGKGNTIIRSNQANAELRYTVTVTDPTKFSALFTDALSWLLASCLAGPIIKGTEGIKVAQLCEKQCRSLFAIASVNDANNSNDTVAHSVPWMANR